ncbi:response regulator [Gemmatimonadota bacterium]
MPDSDSKRAQVLLVEDNLTDALLIRTLLELDDNTRVTLAQDGIRGCQLAENQRWDMLVTDINLPGRDGIDVIQTCRAHQPDTPIIATSAYSNQAYLQAAFRAGANEVLSKPVDRDEFLRTVGNLLKVKAIHDAKGRKILAVGALPGDVEAGCGGILLRHAESGDEVHILVLSMGAAGKEGKDRRNAARRAGQVLGAKLIFPEENEPGFPDIDFMVIRIQDAVHELSPEMVFAPSANDVRESRQNTFAATEIAASRVPGVCSYQAATTTLDFRPTLFEDISEHLDRKMAALSHYEAQVRGRPHLDPDLARATARYWGRFLGYGEVEPLEVVRPSL